MCYMIYDSPLPLCHSETSLCHDSELSFSQSGFVFKSGRSSPSSGAPAVPANLSQPPPQSSIRQHSLTLSATGAQALSIDSSPHPPPPPPSIGAPAVPSNLFKPPPLPLYVAHSATRHSFKKHVWAMGAQAVSMDRSQHPHAPPPPPPPPSIGAPIVGQSFSYDPSSPPPRPPPLPSIGSPIVGQSFSYDPSSPPPLPLRPPPPPSIGAPIVAQGFSAPCGTLFGASQPTRHQLIRTSMFSGASAKSADNLIGPSKASSFSDITATKRRTRALFGRMEFSRPQRSAKYPLFETARSEALKLRWTKIFQMQHSEGYWELTTELGELINVDVDLFANVFLKSKGIHSLGARAHADILKLVATLLVLQLMRVKRLEEGKLLRTLFCLDDSSQTRPERWEELKRAVDWVCWADRQYPCVYSRLEFGRSWESSTRQLLGYEGLPPFSPLSGLNLQKTAAPLLVH
ncbi:protein mono-ADP-ribosyltransferase PARP4 [Dicentrarchus labrax]|uniref:protein mono-ADP-ribosyltransferase PARP4 n=1 Tax=Dicentrarchus labrax TaxID=13489 RepID=UPI0021F546C8|nr:protein mono-ADP-ribosyltransferase PARP4 [Dicentrarchus labrax]